MSVKREPRSPSSCVEHDLDVKEDLDRDTVAATAPADDIDTGSYEQDDRTSVVEEDVGTDDEDTEGKAEQKPASHQQVMEHFKDALAEIIVGDPLLCDLHTEVTLEEIKSQIALEHGQAITVNVRRADDIVLPVVVVHNATVLDLKKAIRRHVVLRQARVASIRHISWRYIWRAYWLYFNGQKLSDDRKLIKEYGIGNRDEVTFMRRLRPTT